jgi:hypothetical protein
MVTDLLECTGVKRGWLPADSCPAVARNWVGLHDDGVTIVAGDGRKLLSYPRTHSHPNQCLDDGVPRRW